MAQPNLEPSVRARDHEAGHGPEVLLVEGHEWHGVTERRHANRAVDENRRVDDHGASRSCARRSIVRRRRSSTNVTGSVASGRVAQSPKAGCGCDLGRAAFFLAKGRLLPPLRCARGRRGRDSNPRTLAGRRFSSAPRRVPRRPSVCRAVWFRRAFSSPRPGSSPVILSRSIELICRIFAGRCPRSTGRREHWLCQRHGFDRETVVRRRPWFGPIAGTGGPRGTSDRRSDTRVRDSGRERGCGGIATSRRDPVKLAAHDSEKPAVTR